ncbi:cytochrome P450 [Mycena sp. CBHHK59/15]|nr:cytochrome P450 [Mycena sp. CBHHK59/15]
MHYTLAGNYHEVLNLNGWDFHKDIAENYGRVVRIDAVFGDKQLYVFDPKAMHQIVVKDQHIFEATSGFTSGNLLIFGTNLMGTVGELHRRQRKMLNPVFSIAHMREMGLSSYFLSPMHGPQICAVPVFYQVTKKLRDVLRSKVTNGQHEFDMLLWMSRTALELVGQAGLGHSFDPLVDDSVPPYLLSAKGLMSTLFKLAMPRNYILPSVINLGPAKLRRLIVNILPWKALHEGRDIVDRIHKTSTEIYNAKKDALEKGDEAVSAQIAHGKDIISILMRDNAEASSTDRLSDEEILGHVTFCSIELDQALIMLSSLGRFTPERPFSGLIPDVSSLVFAAMDTTSAALSRTLHLLAQHPEAQEKLRQEIIAAPKENGELSYDALNSLPYLDAICRETLRLYPPLPISTRTTRKDVVLSLSTPITGVDGTEVSEIAIPSNTNVMMSILSVNRDPAIWGPDSFEWKPERWLTSLPKTVEEAHIPGIYSNLMTFLGGGRACIGIKFSQLEMKIVLALLLERFKFSLTDKDIKWQMGIISVPLVEGSKKPQLPLQLELLP